MSFIKIVTTISLATLSLLTTTVAGEVQPFAFEAELLRGYSISEEINSIENTVGFTIPVGNVEAGIENVLAAQASAGYEDELTFSITIWNK